MVNKAVKIVTVVLLVATLFGAFDFIVTPTVMGTGSVMPVLGGSLGVVPSVLACDPCPDGNPGCSPPPC